MDRQARPKTGSGGCRACKGKEARRTPTLILSFWHGFVSLLAIRHNLELGRITQGDESLQWHGLPLATLNDQNVKLYMLNIIPPLHFSTYLGTYLYSKAGSGGWR